MFYRASDGKIWENMGRKILQSPPGGGIMAKGKVEYNKKLSDISRKFLEEIDYKGIGGIEFKYLDNRFYFIEMNVRVEAILQITENSGVPMSLASYYDFNGMNASLKKLEDEPQQDGHVYMAFIPTMVTRIKTRNIIGLMKDLTSAIFSKNVRLNIYSRDDSKPFWNTLKRLLVK